MIYYTIKVYKEGNYSFTKLFIFRGEVKTIQVLIEGTVENKDGYQSPEIAAEARGRFELLQEKGYQYVVEPSYYKGRAELQWQHYEPGKRHEGKGFVREYCEVAIDTRMRYDTIKQGMKLVDKLFVGIQRKQGWYGVRPHAVTPRLVLEALKRLKARPVCLVRWGEYNMRYCYKAKNVG